MNLYAVLLCFSDEECRQLNEFIEDEQQYSAAVEYSASVWRDQLRPLYEDPTMCRQAFLAQAMSKCAEAASKHPFGYRVLAAFFLTLTDQIEIRVRELDQEEEHGFSR